MATIRLPSDFKEFLRLLNSHEVDYLLVGGYAVAFHGYLRATGDIDIWVGRAQTNAERLVRVFEEFGFDVPPLSPELFLKKKSIVRIGVPPLRIETLTTISGVDFESCYSNRVVANLDGVPVNLINLADLKRNKQASGRHKDLTDLEHLP